MRGRLQAFAAALVCLRNTPAYAGKTGGKNGALKRPQKHPRVCGEDDKNGLLSGLEVETPPRMRGRPFSASSPCSSQRNTPAYAGKTVFQIFQKNPVRKHPRVCGEDPLVVLLVPR